MSSTIATSTEPGPAAGIADASVAALAAQLRRRADAALERCLPAASIQPERLHTAIRYAVMGGGKRLRPLLVYASALLCGVPVERVDAIAAAIELVHAYSLVHDDLPALDNDELRRGRPTTHVAFDVATAILVGDALQAHAYRVLATDAMLGGDAVRRQLVLDLAAASGAAGMAGGQAMDMEAAGSLADLAQAEHICRLKTGRLFEAALLMPSRLAGSLPPPQLLALQQCGEHFGLAFQLADDLLDIETPATLSGKPQGSDHRNQKPTMASLLGREAAHRRLGALREAALASLASWGGEAEFLRWLCRTQLRVADAGPVADKVP